MSMAAERALTKPGSGCLDFAASLISSFRVESEPNFYETKRKARKERQDVIDLLNVPFHRRHQPALLAKVEEEMKRVLGYQSRYPVEVRQQPYDAPSGAHMIQKNRSDTYRVRVYVNLKQWIALEKLGAVTVGNFFLLKISKRKSENEIYARAVEFRSGHRFHTVDISVRRATDGVWRLHRTL